MAEEVKISDRKRTLILINIIISCVGTTLLMTALNTALVSIRADLGIDASTGQWLISGYSLTMGIAMPLSAFLVKRFRTKRLYLTGLGIVGVGLLIALFSVNFPMLLFGRILQACGDGVLLSMSQVVILSMFPPEKRGMAMGWYGLAVGAAPVIAPTLGGVLVDTVGWRAIFALVLIIIIVAFVMANIVYENVLETSHEKLDITSFILSIITFGGITLGVGNLANYGIKNPVTLIALIAGAAGAVVFVYREFHMQKPFLNLKVFLSKEYAIGIILEMMSYFILMGASILMPLYIQSVMGYSATISGLVILPGALCNAVVSPFAGRIYDKTGMRKLAITGAVMIFVPTFAMCFADSGTPLAISSILYAIRSIAFALLLMPLVTWATAHVGKDSVADGTALMSSLRTIAGSIGSAVFVGIMTVVASHSVASYGDNADMHGINMAFLFMTFVAAVLILIAVFLVRNEKNKKIEAAA